MPYRLDAMKEVFEEVAVLGKPMLFTPCRIERGTVPQGLYMYEVRHDDDCRGDPVQIAKWVMVNHWGTLISSTPIWLDSYKTENNAFRDIDSEKDWHYEGVDSTIKEYIKAPAANPKSSTTSHHVPLSNVTRTPPKKEKV